MLISDEDVSVKESSRLRGTIERLLCGLSLANVWAIFIIAELLYLDPRDTYFASISDRHSYLAALLIILLLTLVAWAVFEICQRKVSPTLQLLLALVAFSLIMVTPLDFARRSAGLFTSDLIPLINEYGPIAAVVVVVLGVSGLYMAVKWHLQSLFVLKIVLLILSPFALLNVLKLSFLVVNVESRHPGSPITSIETVAAETQQRPRVIWVIIDELDYRAIFERRPHGLALPELDRLRRESFFATEAVSSVSGTLLAVSRLITGLKFENAEPTSINELAVRLEGSTESKPLDKYPNIFGEMSSRNLDIGIVGFYHPYCRMFGNYARFCQDNFFIAVESTQEADFLETFSMQLSALTPLFNRQNFIRIIERTMKTTSKLSSDPDMDFGFFHVPYAHGPIVFDKETRRFSAWRYIVKNINEGAAKYFHHLVLTDEFLGQLRDNMERSGQWEATTIVVSSDHPWRDSASYYGDFDPRVPFIVKLPYQDVGEEYHQSFNPEITKDLLLEFVDGKISTVDELASWIAAHSPIHTPHPWPLYTPVVGP